MDEEQARDWVRSRFGPSSVQALKAFADMVVAENEHQNLISRSTADSLWARHLVDSAQLVPLAAETKGLWIDVGSGGGFPGMVVALLRAEPMLLVEPRRKRAEFLKRAADELSLSHVTVAQTSIQQVDQPASIISARAVASVNALLKMSRSCASRDTVWILPRGRYDDHEAADPVNIGGVVFHVKHSVTESRSVILVGRCS